MVEPLVEAATRSIALELSDDCSTLTYLVTNVPGVDPMISVIVGEIVHLVRSALDHLAWQLVVLDGGQPNDYTQFPVYDTPTNAKGNPRTVTIQPGIMNQAVLNALVDMQPFQRPQYGEPATDSMLWVLHRLDIIDKHRLLLTAVHRLDFDKPAWWGSNDGDPSPRWSFNPRPLSSGDWVAKFDFGDRLAPPHFDPHLGLAMTLAEPESKWLQGSDVVDGMRGMHHFVSAEINWRFLRLFDEPPLPLDSSS